MNEEETEEQVAKREAQRTSAGNEFVAQILSGMGGPQGRGGGQEQQQQMPMQGQ